MSVEILGKFGGKCFFGVVEYVDAFDDRAGLQLVADHRPTKILYTLVWIMSGDGQVMAKSWLAERKNVNVLSRM